MSRNVLLIEPTIRKAGVDILQKECNIFMAPDGSEETIIQYINKFNIDAIVTRLEKITRKVIENCKGLKIIAQNGVGVDNIDVDAASEQGIMVLNIPDIELAGVAEHALMFILALSKDVFAADKNLRTGNWAYKETSYQMEINNKNLLIIGLGNIGKILAKKAIALEMNVKAFDPYVSKETMEAIKVRKAESLEDGLSWAGFISIHTPLTKETRYLISYKEFKFIKKTAYLINLGRGPIVNEKALYEALKNKEIAGAGIDVFEVEPVSADNPLFELENIIVTPHVGGGTDGLDKCSVKTATRLIEALDGKRPFNIFNRVQLFGKELISENKLSNE